MLDVAHKEGVIVYTFSERKKPTYWTIIAVQIFADVSGELCNCIVSQYVLAWSGL